MESKIFKKEVSASQLGILAFILYVLAINLGGVIGSALMFLAVILSLLSTVRIFHEQKIKKQLGTAKDIKSSTLFIVALLLIVFSYYGSGDIADTSGFFGWIVFIIALIVFFQEKLVKNKKQPKT